MRIEEITGETLQKARDSELLNLHAKAPWFFRQLSKNRITGISKKEFFQKYSLLVSELNDRRLFNRTKNLLDDILFRKKLYGIDIRALENIIKVKDYAVIVGEFVDNPNSVEKIDVCIADDSENVGSEVLNMIKDTIEDETGKEVNFIFNGDVGDRYIPVFDYGLICKGFTERIDKKKTKLTFREIENLLQGALNSEYGTADGIYNVHVIDFSSDEVIYRNYSEGKTYKCPYELDRNNNVILRTTEAVEVVSRYVEKAVIPYKKYPLDESGSWDAAKEVRKADVDDLKKMCAWYDKEHEDNKTAYKLPHHKVDGYTTVWRGVAAAGAALMGARGGVKGIPAGELVGVKNHISKHYEDFGKTAPWERKEKYDVSKYLEELEAEDGEWIEKDAYIEKGECIVEKTLE